MATATPSTSFDSTRSTLAGEQCTTPPRASDAAAVARAREAGVEVRLEVDPHGPHVYPSYCIVLPEAREALGRIAFFVWECLGGYTGGARAKGPRRVGGPAGGTARQSHL